MIKFVGLTQYSAIKYISKKRNIAKSTIKYSFRKLVKNGFVNYEDKIEITQKGEFLIKFLGASSNGKIFGSRPINRSSTLLAPIRKFKRYGVL